MKADANLISPSLFAGRVSHRTPAQPVTLMQSLYLALVCAANVLLAVFMAWYVIATIGINEESDAFFASSALPQFAFALLTATLLPVVVPLLAIQSRKEFRDDAWSFFSLTTAVFLIVGVILAMSSRAWVPLLVPGFSAAGKDLTVQLTRIQLASMVLNAMTVMLWAAHHARNRFLWVEVSAGVANLGGLVFLMLTLHRFGVAAAAWNTVFFNSVKLILLLPILGRWRRPEWNSATLREGWRRLKPLLPNHMYLRTEPILDRFLVSMTGAGTLSLLYLSQQVYASLILLIGKTVIAPSVPGLAVNARAGKWEDYRRQYQGRLWWTLGLALLGCVLIICGRKFLEFLVGHAGVTAENVHMLWLTMIALAGTLIGGTLVQVIAGAFYAAGNTRTPSKISALVYTVFIPLKVAAFMIYGLLGLAVTMSAYFLTNACVQLLWLRKSSAMTADQQYHERLP